MHIPRAKDIALCSTGSVFGVLPTFHPSRALVLLHLSRGTTYRLEIMRMRERARETIFVAVAAVDGISYSWSPVHRARHGIINPIISAPPRHQHAINRTCVEERLPKCTCTDEFEARLRKMIYQRQRSFNRWSIWKVGYFGGCNRAVFLFASRLAKGAR